MNWLYTFWSKLSIAAGDFADYTEIEDIYNTIMVIVCVVCAGLAAGLTMGMLSFDETKLEVKTISGTENERVAAEAILPLIKQHHLLLVTLLLFNSLANETLPIFLGALVPNYIAIILSVTLVLIFGEIIPSAFFTGPNQLLTAAKMTKLVYFLMFIFWPIAYPLGKLLDHIFGVEEDHGSLSRSELEALVTLQDSNRLRVKSTGNLDVDELMKMPNSSESCNHSESRGLSQYEINVMTGILQSPKVNAGTSLIKTKDVFMLSSSSILNDKCLCDIRDVGYSRIPVYRRKDRQHILGYLLVKDLIVVGKPH